MCDNYNNNKYYPVLPDVSRGSQRLSAGSMQSLPEKVASELKGENPGPCIGLLAVLLLESEEKWLDSSLPLSMLLRHSIGMLTVSSPLYNRWDNIKHT